MSQNATASELLARLHRLDQAAADAEIKYRAADEACVLAKHLWRTTEDAAARAHDALIDALSNVPAEMWWPDPARAAPGKAAEDDEK